MRALRRPYRLAGRALPGVRRPAARLRFGPRGGLLSRPGKVVRACLEGGRSPPVRVSRRRARRRARGPACGRPHHLYPARRRPLPPPRSPAGRRARPRARRPLGPRRGAAALASTLDRAADRADCVRSGGRTSVARSAVVALSRARSCSWTTSTRPARRWELPPRLSGPRGAREFTSSLSPGPCANLELRSRRRQEVPGAASDQGTNDVVTPEVREYLESKLARLDKQLADETPVEVELAEETKHGQFTAAATVFVKGQSFGRRVDLGSAGLDRQARREPGASGHRLSRETALRAPTPHRAPSSLTSARFERAPVEGARVERAC